MWWVIGAIVFVCLLFLFLLILLSRVHIEISITYNENKKEFFISLRWLRFITYQKTVSLKDLDEDLLDENGEVDLDETLKALEANDENQSVIQKIKLVKQLLPDVKQLLKSIRLHQLEWATNLGLKHAHHTAILTGLLYTLKGATSSFLLSFMQNVSSPQMIVNPIYSNSVYETEVKCIFSFQIGQIMRDTFRIFKRYKKIKKVDNYERASN